MRFPECTIHRFPQRSEEWFNIRKGKLTGSAMGSWLAERPEVRLTIPEIKDILTASGIDFRKSATRPDLLTKIVNAGQYASYTKSFESARLTALSKLIGSISACNEPDEWEVDPDGPPPRNPALWAVWNGIRLEAEAVERFQNDTGLEVEEVGFCEHRSKYSGVSPDGLIVGKNEGFEGKAPLSATHARYLLEGTLPDAYRDQVHGSMAVTGADAWWFQSYCPGAIIEVFRIRVERDEYTERMESGLIEFADYVKSETRRLIEMSKEGGQS